MKITYRILIINFAIVFLVIVSSAFAFYSIMYSVLTSQQSKYLQNSTNHFIIAYREAISNTEEDFLYLLKNGIDQKFSSQKLFEKNIDFILKTNPAKFIINKSYKENVSVSDKLFSLEEFITRNPFLVIKTYKNKDGSSYYYGKILDSYAMNEFSRRIGADIALVWNNTIALSSDESQNQKFLFSLNQAYKYLALKNNSDIFSQKDESTDILVTLCKPFSNSEDLNISSQFLVFTTLNEAVDLRSSLKNILIIIGLSGVLISLILTLLFTDKLRRQISDLSKATEVIKTGNFQNKISIKSKDEIGELATAFNLMVTELEKNQKAKNEYSDFITMLNQNPSLKEISDAALGKIINICGFVAGALYIVEEDGIKIASSFGIEKGHNSVDSNFINDVIHKRELIELEFKENPPSIKIGSIKIDLKYLTLVPIVYNTKVIAVLELSGTNQPKDESRDYLSKIQEHLAIGLANAIAFVQLEKLVVELKQLNEDYQTQNIQIRKQNETLIDLHKKLKEKAEELEFQKQKAEESTKLKSQFLASMSHELRTPMNSILGLTELMLEQGTIKGKDRERIGVVLSSGKRLMGLINDILDLSKIEAGKMELHEENMLLEDLINEVEHSISPLLKDKKIDFRVIRDTSTSIIINTDRGKVTQVLINLLGNAIKFTESGYVELKISSAGNKTLIFIVNDSGIGITENDQKVIFDEFRQVDGTSSKKYSGTGLGLTICKKIAGLLQGSISVSSKLGVGSSFTFIIPLNFIEIVRDRISAHEFYLASENKLDVNEETLSGKENILIEEIIGDYIGQVLVVDDDPDTLFTINEILESCNCKTYLVKGGKECLNMLEQVIPDIILLDIMMPEMDGFQTINKIKVHPKWAHIPVFAVTAKAMLEDKDVILRNGFDDYVPKPINAGILSMKIKKVFMNLKVS